jgi:2-polyprenyl-3-methyl-5-hydroxy-6-metoxy-1,4-benzoquinol methylase
MVPSTDHRQEINAHYGRSDLTERVLAALRDAGLDPDALTADTLAPLDHFHTGGKPATLALLALANLPRGSRVLDVGGGIGGPARTLAREADCQVTVLDLTEAFCQVGALLTARTGLGTRVTFRQGSALEMPFSGRAAHSRCPSPRGASTRRGWRTSA